MDFLSKMWWGPLVKNISWPWVENVADAEADRLALLPIQLCRHLFSSCEKINFMTLISRRQRYIDSTAVSVLLYLQILRRLCCLKMHLFRADSTFVTKMRRIMFWLVSNKHATGCQSLFEEIDLIFHDFFCKQCIFMTISFILVFKIVYSDLLYVGNIIFFTKVSV